MNTQHKIPPMLNDIESFTVHYVDMKTGEIKEINISDEDTREKLVSLYSQFRARSIVSLIHIVTFWVNCMLMAWGLYLHLTKYEFLLTLIIIVGFCNIYYLKRHNDWETLREESSNNFLAIVNDYIQKHANTE
jgi:hypothetical protein